MARMAPRVPLWLLVSGSIILLVTVKVSEGGDGSGSGDGLNTTDGSFGSSSSQSPTTPAIDTSLSSISLFSSFTSLSVSTPTASGTPILLPDTTSSISLSSSTSPSGISSSLIFLSRSIGISEHVTLSSSVFPTPTTSVTLPTPRPPTSITSETPSFPITALYESSSYPQLSDFTSTLQPPSTTSPPSITHESSFIISPTLQYSEPQQSTITRSSSTTAPDIMRPSITRHTPSSTHDSLSTSPSSALPTRPLGVAPSHSPSPAPSDPPSASPATSHPPSMSPSEDRKILSFWLLIGLIAVATVLSLILFIMICICLWHRRHVRQTYSLTKSSKLTYGRSYMEDPLPDLSTDADSDDGSQWKVQTHLKHKFNNVLESLNRNINMLDSLNSIGRAIEPGTGCVTEEDEKTIASKL